MTKGCSLLTKWTPEQNVYTMSRKTKTPKWKGLFTKNDFYFHPRFRLFDVIVERLLRLRGFRWCWRWCCRGRYWCRRRRCCCRCRGRWQPAKLHSGADFVVNCQLQSTRIFQNSTVKGRKVKCHKNWFKKLFTSLWSFRCVFLTSYFTFTFNINLSCHVIVICF